MGLNPQTISDVETYLLDVIKAAEAIIPLTPVAALEPLIQLADGFVTQLKAAQAGQSPALAAEVSAADAAATAAEMAKFPAG